MLVRSAIAATALIMGPAACHHGADTTSEPEVETAAETSKVMITGQAAYRERIALQPGHVFRVTLSDVSKADGLARVIAETSRTLDGEQVPLNFELSVDPSMLTYRHLYSLRATLTDPNGNLAWTTDTVKRIDPENPAGDAGMLALVRVASAR